MEQILLPYGLPQETVTAIMMLYGNTNVVKVRSPGGDTDFFNIVAGFLRGNKLAPYLFIICLDYILGTPIDLKKCFPLKKARSKRYPTETITGADYAEDIAFLENTPTQAESLLHSLEQAEEDIGFYVNADKVEYVFWSRS